MNEAELNTLQKEVEETYLIAAGYVALGLYWFKKQSTSKTYSDGGKTRNEAIQGLSKEIDNLTSNRDDVPYMVKDETDLESECMVIEGAYLYLCSSAKASMIEEHNQQKPRLETKVLNDAVVDLGERYERLCRIRDQSTCS